MMKTIITVVIVAVVGIVGFMLIKGNDQPEATPTPTPPTLTPIENVGSTVSPSASPTTSITSSEVKTFNVSGANFRFNPSEIRVKKGDMVKIVFTANDMMHDWVVDDFNVRTKIVASGKTDTIQFVADKTGTFEYYCSVGQHRANGMVGKLIVE